MSATARMRLLIAELQVLLREGPRRSDLARFRGSQDGPIGLSLAEDPVHAWRLRCEEVLQRIEVVDQERSDSVANAAREWERRQRRVARAAARLSGRDRGRILRALES